MSKEAVIQAIGNPDQFLSAKRVGSQLVEAWEYHRMRTVVGPDYIDERYQVVFTNGQLSSYESSGDARLQVNVRH